MSAALAIRTDSRAMRVILTCDFFLKYATAQSAALSRAGAEVLLVCRDHALEFGGDGSERERALDAARAAGVTVVELPGRQSDIKMLPMVARVRKRIERFQPDVLHAHARSDPRLLPLLPRRPIVFTFHDPEAHPGQPVANSAARRRLDELANGAWKRRAHAIVLHSARLRDQLEFRDRQRCVVVPHGVDVRETPLPPPSAPTVGFFGRLAPYKGLDVLARAMPRVWSARPEVRLVVAGAGSTTFPLSDPRAEVRAGYLPEDGVESFFAGTSIAVLPYTQASQTGVGSLAVGSGVPVVASRIGGLPDLTLDDSYLCAPGDSEDLAAAILRHLDDGVDVRKRVLAEVAGPHSWDAASAQTLALYEELIARR